VKAALLTSIGKFEIQQVPKPEIKNDTDVLVRIKMVGVCGSDIHYYSTGKIGSQVVEFPFIVGHEAAGIVEKVGAKVTRVKPGQRIAIDPATSCGECDQCKAGRENTCRNLLFMGNPSQMQGALCEYVVLNEKSCFPISESTTFEQAVLSEPLAIAVYAVEQSMINNGDNAAILGAGPIGTSVFHALIAKKISNIYLTDKIDARLEHSKKLNPKWCGNPDKLDIIEEISQIEPLLMDIVFECSGEQDAITQGIKLLKPGGKLVIIGIPEVDDISFPIHELRRNEITILNIRRQSNCTQKAIDLLENGKVNLSAMATHHYSLEETGAAFNLVSNYREGVMKAMICID
jgi:L-iditol 2-dehydrogenase